MRALRLPTGVIPVYKALGWIFALYAFGVLILPYVTTDIVMEGSGVAQFGLFFFFVFFSLWAFWNARRGF